MNKEIETIFPITDYLVDEEFWLDKGFNKVDIEYLRNHKRELFTKVIDGLIDLFPVELTDAADTILRQWQKETAAKLGS